MWFVRVRAGLAAGLASTVLLLAGCGTPAPAADGEPSPATGGAPAVETLTLPAPTGPYPVGTAVVRMVDRDRRDPLAIEPSPRELMVQFWYPAAGTAGAERARYMTPRAAAAMERRFGLPPGTIAGARTHAYVDAPAATANGPFPVVVYSPGAGDPRTTNTATAEDLASHGYVVIAPDSTYEAPVVEFPDGRVATAHPVLMSALGLPGLLELRVADVRFLLDALAAGRVPERLAGALDLDRVGMFGHSLGGAAAAAAMHAGRRIDAGVNLDGRLAGPVVDHGLERPFLLFGSEGHTPRTDPSWARFLPRLSGWHRWLQLDGSGHYTFTDFGMMARDWGLRRQLGPDRYRAAFGSIDGERAHRLYTSYVRAFFDRFLRGERSGLLTGPDPDRPAVEFMADPQRHEIAGSVVSRR